MSNSCDNFSPECAANCPINYPALVGMARTHALKSAVVVAHDHAGSKLLELIGEAIAAGDLDSSLVEDNESPLGTNGVLVAPSLLVRALGPKYTGRIDQILAEERELAVSYSRAVVARVPGEITCEKPVRARLVAGGAVISLCGAQVKRGPGFEGGVFDQSLGYFARAVVSGDDIEPDVSDQSPS